MHTVCKKRQELTVSEVCGTQRHDQSLVVRIKPPTDFMKIKVKKRSYAELEAAYRSRQKKHKRPKRPSLFFRTLMKLVALPDMMATHFKCEKIGMEKLGKNEPAFFIMNHSSFIDLEITATALYPRAFNIVATTDAFIGKEWLMRQIGCIPTKKFVADITMVRDMVYAAKKKKCSIVMFPEAGYTFDGTATTMSDSLGKCVKLLGIPLVSVITEGAFLRDPLYNNLQRRKIKVSAKMEYLLTADEVKSMSADEISAIIAEKFAFDGFKWQKENGIKISESFRADGLERLLYKCPDCQSEGRMLGKGISLKCNACGAEYSLSEYGVLVATSAKNGFSHIPDWYKWEREEVKKELLDDRYLLDIPVNIYVSFEPKNVFDVGSGRLVHDKNGFRLTSDDGEIDYTQKPLSCYSINSDFNWYEIGDIISIGNNERLFYCFPTDQSVPVAKARLAAEELYKLNK